MACVVVAGTMLSGYFRQVRRTVDGEERTGASFPHLARARGRRESRQLPRVGSRFGRDSHARGSLACRVTRVTVERNNARELLAFRESVAPDAPRVRVYVVDTTTTTSLVIGSSRRRRPAIGTEPLRKLCPERLLSYDMWVHNPCGRFLPTDRSLTRSSSRFTSVRRECSSRRSDIPTPFPRSVLILSQPYPCFELWPYVNYRRILWRI